MPPGSPQWVGKDVVRYFWTEPEREKALPGKRKFDRRLSMASNEAIALDPEFEAEVLRLRRDIASLRFEFELSKLGSSRRKYLSDQPRVPAGNPDGGQWTSEGGGGGLHEFADSVRCPSRQ